MIRTIGLLLILLGLVLNHATTTNVKKSSEDENSECFIYTWNGKFSFFKISKVPNGVFIKI